MECERPILQSKFLFCLLQGGEKYYEVFVQVFLQVFYCSLIFQSLTGPSYHSKIEKYIKWFLILFFFSQLANKLWVLFQWVKKTMYNSWIEIFTHKRNEWYAWQKIITNITHVYNYKQFMQNVMTKKLAVWIWPFFCSAFNNTTIKILQKINVLQCDECHDIPTNHEMPKIKFKWS